MLKYFSILLTFVTIQLHAQSVDDYVKDHFPYSLPVYSESKMIDSTFIFSLTKELLQINQKSNAEYGVYFVEDFHGFNRKDLAQSLREYLILGYGYNDQGVLFLIATNERRLYVSTSHQFISNDNLQEIVDNSLIPFLKEDKYKEGILKSIHSIESQIDDQNNFNNTVYFIIALIFLIIIIDIIMNRYKSNKSKPRIRFDSSTQNSNSSFDSSSFGGSDSGGGGAGGDF